MPTLLQKYIYITNQKTTMKKYTQATIDDIVKEIKQTYTEEEMIKEINEITEKDIYIYKE